ncbi:MAG TPA: ribosome maturation factor RimM [Gemmatimonadales bacterium]|nr:ribosome maturation factor RimM [Gemmatimonadales bacterium]
MVAPTHLAVGRISKPHGVRGDVLVYPMTDEPAQRFQQGAVLEVLDRSGVPTGDSVTVERVREYGRTWLLHLAGFDEREQLEKLRGAFLAIRVGAARPLEEGEFFLYELIGLAVELRNHTPVGVVREVYEAPQGWLLAVVDEAGKERLIPFRADVVMRVDRTARLVQIVPPEGLLEL